jgi:hypothetical protein
VSQDPSLPDPLEQMRKAYDDAVAGWAKTLEKMVGTRDFAVASSEFLKRYLELQENIRAASKATADALHLPTKDDFDRIAQLVINVERKVDEVSDSVHEVASRPEPPSAEAALAAIADRLEAIERTLAELAARPVPSASPAPSAAAEAPKPPAAATGTTRRRTRAPKAG